MPRSRSRSIESSSCARISRAATVCVQLEDAIGERRLAVVDVRDDREVADVRLVHRRARHDRWWISALQRRRRAACAGGAGAGAEPRGALALSLRRIANSTKDLRGSTAATRRPFGRRPVQGSGVLSRPGETHSPGTYVVSGDLSSGACRVGLGSPGLCSPLRAAELARDQPVHLMRLGHAHRQHRADIDERACDPRGADADRSVRASDTPSRSSSSRHTTHATPREQCRRHDDPRCDHRRLRAFQPPVEADPQTLQPAGTSSPRWRRPCR